MSQANRTTALHIVSAALTVLTTGGSELLESRWGLTTPAARAAETPAAAPAIPPNQPAPNERSPRDVVAALNDALLGVLRQSNDLDYAGRFTLLAPILENMFDLEYMARQAVGRSFLDLDEPQRQAWYTLFKDYMTANYAARFDHFSDQQFEILGEEPGAKDTVLVRTRVIDPAAENVDLSYRMHRTDGAWKVADVYLKGTVSELALRRSEYASVLKRDGFEALIANVKAKIADFANPTDD